MIGEWLDVVYDACFVHTPTKFSVLHVSGGCLA